MSWQFNEYIISLKKIEKPDNDEYLSLIGQTIDEFAKNGNTPLQERDNTQWRQGNFDNWLIYINVVFTELSFSCILDVAYGGIDKRYFREARPDSWRI